MVAAMEGGSLGGKADPVCALVCALALALVTEGRGGGGGGGKEEVGMEKVEETEGRRLAVLA